MMVSQEEQPVQSSNKDLIGTYDTHIYVMRKISRTKNDTSTDEETPWKDESSFPVPLHVFFNKDSKIYILTCKMMGKPTVTIPLSANTKMMKSSAQFLHCIEPSVPDTYGFGFTDEIDLEKFYDDVVKIIGELKKQNPTPIENTNHLLMPLSNVANNYNRQTFPGSSFDTMGLDLNSNMVVPRSTTPTEAPLAMDMVLQKYQMLQKQYDALSECLINPPAGQSSTDAISNQNDLRLALERIELMERQRSVVMTLCANLKRSINDVASQIDFIGSVLSQQPSSSI